jgi:hypothetical protein
MSEAAMSRALMEAGGNAFLLEFLARTRAAARVPGRRSRPSATSPGTGSTTPWGSSVASRGPQRCLLSRDPVRRCSCADEMVAELATIGRAT